MEYRWWPEILQGRRLILPPPAEGVAGGLWNAYNRGQGGLSLVACFAATWPKYTPPPSYSVISTIWLAREGIPSSEPAVRDLLALAAQRLHWRWRIATLPPCPGWTAQSPSIAQ